jgi:hypothetical protein
MSSFILASFGKEDGLKQEIEIVKIEEFQGGTEALCKKFTYSYQAVIRYNGRQKSLDIVMILK